MEIDISKVLEKLHNPRGRPRLEIEGLGGSIESQYLGFFPYDSSGSREKRAVYVSNDLYDESGGGSNNDWDYIFFNRSELEGLVRTALDSEPNEVTRTISGSRVTFRNYWNAQGKGWEEPKKEEHVNLSLSLRIAAMEPHLSIGYRE